MYLFIKNNFNINRVTIRLFVIIFFAAIMSKGLVVFRGYAIDDYGFIPVDGVINLELFFSQGRYIMAAIVWFIESIGANISDMYFSMGIVALFLQSVFLVSIIRFVGFEKIPSAGIVGAIIASHPYLTEIFTFRVALPTYSVALFFSIIALEMSLLSPTTWRTRIFSLVATVAMLFTYQVFINYFVVAIIFAFAFGQVSNIKNGFSLNAGNILRRRSAALALSSLFAVFIFATITFVSKIFGVTDGLSISKILTLEQLPKRWAQMSSSFLNIYWYAEPVLSKNLKLIIALMLGLSLLIILKYFVRASAVINSMRDVFFVVFIFLLLVPVSFGVILPFEVWWPVPRVIAHVSVIIGFILLLADSCMLTPENRFIRRFFLVARGATLIGFIFLSNQIFIDQQRINQWDTMMANRVIARLEMHPDFNKIKFLYISKGSWPWPYTTKLRTTEGDMNVSAFLVDYTKIPLLSEISGLNFKRASGSNADFGENYCRFKKPWPHIESVIVDNELAIICLKK